MSAYHRIILWLIFTPFSAQAGSPSADVDARLTAMQRQADAMNKRLEHLEQMLESRLPPLDAGVDTDVAPTSPPATPPQEKPELAAFQELDRLRVSWKQIARGLSGTELRGLLGEPDSKLALGRETLWYYLYPGIGTGSVMLSRQGKVTSWQPPPLP